MIRDDLVREGQKLVSKLETMDSETQEYAKVLANLRAINAEIREFDKQEAELSWNDQLNEAKLAEVKKPFWKRDGFISALIGAGATIGTTGLILNYEKLGNLTSKATSLIPKPRLR